MRDYNINVYLRSYRGGGGNASTSKSLRTRKSKTTPKATIDHGSASNVSMDLGHSLMGKVEALAIGMGTIHLSKKILSTANTIYGAVSNNRYGERNTAGLLSALSRPASTGYSMIMQDFLNTFEIEREAYRVQQQRDKYQTYLPFQIQNGLTI
jgi:hypothetical protein